MSITGIQPDLLNYQLLDEITLLAGEFQDRSLYTGFPSALLTVDTPTFERHLKSRSSAISSAIKRIFSRDQLSDAEASDLQGRIAKLLAAEKSHVNELEKIRLEKEQMEERLETASMRYMVAEKKLDRAKSTTVARLERQATAGGRGETGTGLGGSADAAGKSDQANGLVDSESLADAERAKKEAVAASAKQAEQLEKLAVENQKLSTQVTEYGIRLSNLSEEDYAHTDLFKQFKKQHEDVVTKLNGLEATNAELRQETKKLQIERSSYRMQLDTETQASISEKELQLTKAESDLARIRTTRDELQADAAVRKVTQDSERTAFNDMKGLVAIQDAQISTLEAEAERLKSNRSHDGSVGLDSLSIEELRSKYSSLDDNNSMLKKEITTMMERFRKMSANASHRILNTSEMEEKVLRLGAEKAKADQKYFAAMKAKEAREQEIRMLRAQNSKSSDIVSQLKDAEIANNALVANLEKYVAESKDALASVESKRHAVQNQVSEKELVIEGLKKQIEELKSSIVSKDNACTVASSSQRKIEVEIEKLKVGLADKDKRLETWRARGLGTENEHYEALRVGSHPPSLLVLILIVIRVLSFAASAERTSRTPSSKPAVMFCARTVSRSASNRACESVLTVTKPLARMITCESLFDTGS